MKTLACTLEYFFLLQLLMKTISWNRNDIFFLMKNIKYHILIKKYKIFF